MKSIREVDPYHMLSIEGAHWAADTGIFDKKYDDNMVLHFHRYAVIPPILLRNLTNTIKFWSMYREEFIPERIRQEKSLMNILKIVKWKIV